VVINCIWSQLLYRIIKYMYVCNHEHDESLNFHYLQPPLIGRVNVFISWLDFEFPIFPFCSNLVAQTTFYQTILPYDLWIMKIKHTFQQYLIEAFMNTVSFLLSEQAHLLQSFGIDLASLQRNYYKLPTKHVPDSSQNLPTKV